MSLLNTPLPKSLPCLYMDNCCLLFRYEIGPSFFLDALHKFDRFPWTGLNVSSTQKHLILLLVFITLLGCGLCLSVQRPANRWAQIVHKIAKCQVQFPYIKSHLFTLKALLLSMFYSSMCFRVDEFTFLVLVMCVCVWGGVEYEKMCMDTLRVQKRVLDHLKLNFQCIILKNKCKFA